MQRPADPRMLALCGPSCHSGSWPLVSARGPRAISLLWPFGPCRASVLPFPGPCCLWDVRLCSFAAVSRAPPYAWPVSRSEQLRQLTAQLASLATLEDAVAPGIQTLLEVPQESVDSLLAAVHAPCTTLLRPRSCSLYPLPKAAPNRPRGSILLSQRGPRGCPSRAVRLTARSPPTAAPAPRPLVLALSSPGARTARPVPPPRPRLAAQLSQCVCRPAGKSRSPLAPLRLGVANVTSTAGERDATPNSRCGVRFSVKTSPALQCGPASPIHHPMLMRTTSATPSCSCFPPPSSRPPLHSDLSELDELMVALSCRFALDVFTVAQQDRPNPTFWLTIPDATFGSESWPRPGF